MSANRDQYLERPLPSSPEAERAVLGGIILDNGLISEAIELLKADDFYTPSHRRVFAAMVTLFERGAEINPILIGEELRKEGLLEQSGGVSEISNLTYGLPKTESLAGYANIVRDKSQLRSLIKAAQKIISAALEEEDEVPQIVDSAEAQIFEIAERRIAQQFTRLDELAALSLEDAEKRTQTGHMAASGVATGFTELDGLTGGWQNTDLVIVAGRTSMGKTSLALGLAENASQADPNAVVAIFSLEMSKKQVTDRILCSNARVDVHRYRNGYLNREDWSRFAQSAAWMQNRKIWIDDTTGISALEIRAKARRLLAREKRLDMIVVDHIQFMRSMGRVENRQLEVSQITRDLKSIAKELGVPVIAVSHVSRASETRGDKRPQLSDLRESGSIENDADVVAFVFREEYYNRTEENHGQAELIIAKQRNGPVGSVKLAFLKEFTRFENVWNDPDVDRQERLLA